MKFKKIFSSETTEPISTKLRRRFLCEFPIGSYVKLSSAVGAILIEGPDIFLEENHPMTISSKFCSY
jgi:hypothetical protein